VENPDGEFPLRAGVGETLAELDRRGILLSLASKNNQSDAERVLRTHGIWDLFLHPRIDWQPKSRNIKEIVNSFNIGMDAVAFVDDSPFEREEVLTALPEIRVFDALDPASLLDLPAFNVAVTSDSVRRRRMYAEESSRQDAFGHADEDYDAFLRSCEMELHLSALDESNRERVHELVQRTNQLNFSGNRYSRDALDRLLADSTVLPVVMSCRDKFGDYGIVGFAILKVHETDVEVSDMMFSCRIQGKKVEHAFLVHLLTASAHASLRKCFCRFRETARNAHAAVVFSDLGFDRITDQRRGVRHSYAMKCSEVAFSVPATVGGDLNVEWALKNAGELESGE